MIDAIRQKKKRLTSYVDLPCRFFLSFSFFPLRDLERRSQVRETQNSVVGADGESLIWTGFTTYKKTSDGVVYGQEAI